MTRAWGLLIELVDTSLTLRLEPLSGPLGRLLHVDLVVARTHFVIAHPCVHQLCILLADKLTLLVFLVTKYVIVGGDRWRVGQ